MKIHRILMGFLITVIPIYGYVQGNTSSTSSAIINENEALSIENRKIEEAIIKKSSTGLKLNEYVRNKLLKERREKLKKELYKIQYGRTNKSFGKYYADTRIIQSVRANKNRAENKNK